MIVRELLNWVLLRPVLQLAGASGDHSLGDPYFNYMPRYPEHLYYVAAVIIGFCASLFGAIHCLSWSSPFPTSLAMNIWRICSIYLTFSPLILAIPPGGSLLRGDHWLKGVPYWLYLLVAPSGSLAVMLYFIARITLIAVALWGLFNIPASGHTSIGWSDFIPHI